MSDHLPQLTRDLLFLDNSKLMRWNHATGQLEILVGPETFDNFQAVRNIAFASIGPGLVLGSVLSFSVSEDGQKIAVVVADTAPDKYNLMLFDLPTHHLTFVYQGTSQGLGLLDMAISPDGQWLAYIPQDLAPPVIPTDTPVATSTPYPMNLSQDLRPREGQDHVGLVARPLSGGGPRSGVIYAVRIDAPDERIEVGHCGEIHSFEYPELVARLTWMRDERLFVIRRVTGSGLDNYSLSGEVWHIDSTNSDSLVRDETISIPVSADDFPIFTSPVQLDDGRLAFAVLNSSNANYQTRGLYTFTPGDTMPHKANGLPPVSDYYYSDVSWSRDGGGAVVQGQQGGSLLYAPADGSALYDLRPVLGNNVCCFTWLK